MLRIRQSLYAEVSKQRPTGRDPERKGTSRLVSGCVVLQSIKKGHCDDQGFGDLLCRIRAWRDRVRKRQNGGAMGFGRDVDDGSHRRLGELFMADFSRQLVDMTAEFP